MFRPPAEWRCNVIWSKAAHWLIPCASESETGSHSSREEMVKSVLVITLLVVLLLLSLSYWQRSRPASAQIPAPALDMSGAGKDQPFANQRASLPRGPIAPSVMSDTWLNSEPLSPAELRGQVVLVDFWTFDCINCRNTIPYLRRWYDQYHSQGLVIVGVHSPEFTYEHDVANVQQAIRDLKIPYPVALDNDMKTWNAYRVYAWPTWFIVDKQGRIRFSHIGEGAYAESEQAILALLKE
jgi:thiol-disulfide isomerase/thioredoxin